MMIKRSDLAGVKTVKSYKELLGHLAAEMTKLHDKVHNNVKQKILSAATSRMAKR